MTTTVDRAFARSAATTPDAIAVVDARQQVTYRTLDHLVTALASAVGARGIGPGARVAIALPRSLEAIVATLAVLRAGAATVPLDAGSPPARLQRILTDARPSLAFTPVGTVPRHLDSLPTWPLWIDGDRIDGAAMASGPLRHASAGETLATLLYTSGSTGTPKGVMIPHRALASFVAWAVAYVNLTPSDRVTHQSPLHFDLSTFEIYATLAAGATICVLPEEASPFAASVVDWLQRRRVSVLYAVPSLLVRLIDDGVLSTRPLPDLRVVLFAGEVFPGPALARFRAALPHVALHNLYGPTETNVCTAHPLPAGPIDPSIPTPIGRPCPQAQVVCIDSAGSPVTAPGAVGELVVAGPTLMSGYWGDERESARALAPHPALPGADAAFRTRDRVRIDSDGRYVFLGRTDHQIKRRGFRIELGDVEAALHRHPGVAEAMVVATGVEPGLRLTAWIAPRAAAPSPDDLRRHAREQLPRAMIPDAWRIVPALPRTRTGKLDRRFAAVASEAPDV